MPVIVIILVIAGKYSIPVQTTFSGSDKRQPRERRQFENVFVGNGRHTVEIRQDKILHNARLTTDNDIAVYLHYCVTYLKDTKYRLRVFEKTNRKSKKSKIKLAINALKTLVAITIFTDLLVYVMLSCKDQNGKVSTCDTNYLSPWIFRAL